MGAPLANNMAARMRQDRALLPASYSQYSREHYTRLSNKGNEVTRRPKKVAESQILGDLRVTSLKRLPKLVTFELF